MKIPVSNQFLKCAVIFLAAMSSVAVRAENATNAVSRLAPPALVKSVFVDDPHSGIDPFFPQSRRRLEVFQQRSIATNIVQQPMEKLNLLTLKGISGTKNQRLALINSSTVGVGELAEIRCGPQVVKVRCREIRDRSVIIELEGLGETRELKLREGI